MALSQAQKKFINVVISNPQQAFDDIKSGNINLNSYKNEFFQSGEGLLHFMVLGLKDNASIYFSMILHVLQNSTLSLQDYSGRKESAWKFLTDSYNKDFNNNVLLNDYKIAQRTKHLEWTVEFLKNDKKAEYHLFISTLAKLAENKDLALYDELYTYIPKQKTHSISYGSLLSALIKNNDVNRLEQIVQDDDVKKAMMTKGASIYRNGKKNDNELSNFLVFAISCRNFEAAKYLMEQGLNIDGTVEIVKTSYGYSSYNPYSSGYNHGSSSRRECKYAVSAFTESINANMFEIYKQIFTSSPIEQLEPSLLKFVTTYVNPYRTHGSSQIVHLLNHENPQFKEYFQSRYSDIIKKADKKLNILAQVLLSNIPFDEMKVMIEQSLINITEDDRSKSHSHLYAQGLINNILQRDLNDLNVCHHAAQCLVALQQAGLNTYNTDALYTEKFFSSPLLIKEMIIQGWDFESNLPRKDNENKNPTNVLNIFLELYSKNNTNLQQDIDNVRLSLQALYDMNSTNRFLPNKGMNLLENTLNKRNTLIFDLLSDDDILKFNELANKSPAHYFGYKAEIDINYFAKRLIDLNIDFFTMIGAESSGHVNKTIPFYKLLEENADQKLMDTVLKNQNQDIHELSKETVFWNYVVSDETAQYVKERGANFDNPQMLKDVCTYATKGIRMYLKYGGNTSWRDGDNNNVLHTLLEHKHAGFELAFPIVEFAPQLCSETNRHGKFAISYFMPEIERTCVKNIGVKHPEDAHAKKLDLLVNYLETGLDDATPKALKFLRQQMDKYTAVYNEIPHLRVLMEFNHLQKTIKPQENVVVKRKVKI